LDRLDAFDQNSWNRSASSISRRSASCQGSPLYNDSLSNNTLIPRERLAWGPAWVDTSLVFTREDGQVLHPEHVTKRFARLVRDAGLPPITLHGVRNSSATAALAAGEPLKVVSERLGHASTSITANLYQHVLPSMDERTANAVANLILGDRNRTPSPLLSIRCQRTRSP
jgi:integrase